MIVSRFYINKEIRAISAIYLKIAKGTRLLVTKNGQRRSTSDCMHLLTFDFIAEKDTCFNSKWNQN